MRIFFAASVDYYNKLNCLIESINYYITQLNRKYIKNKKRKDVNKLYVFNQINVNTEIIDDLLMFQ